MVSVLTTPPAVPTTVASAEAVAVVAAAVVVEAVEASVIVGAVVVAVAVAEALVTVEAVEVAVVASRARRLPSKWTKRTSPFEKLVDACVEQGEQEDRL